MVDPHHGRVGHDIAGNAAFDMHRLQCLAVLAPFDDRTAGLVGLDDRKQFAQAMNRIASHPWASSVGPGPLKGDLDPQGSLTTGFERSKGWLAEQGDIAIEQIGPLGFDLAQSVVDHRHLLARIEHVGEVDGRFGDGAGEFEHRRQPALHVAGANAVHPVALDAGPSVAIGRHRVGVTTENESSITAEHGAGDEIVADAVDGEVRARPKLRLDDRHDLLLVEAFGRNVDERGREGEHVAGGQAWGDNVGHEIRPLDRGRGGCH